MKTCTLLLASLLAILPAQAHAEEPERVIMKLSDFLKLYEQTKKKEEKPPRDHAIASARLKYPAANHAAATIVIWDLQRNGAYPLPDGTP